MAHVAKYGKAALGHLCKHYERAKDDDGKYIKFGNEDIDTSKSCLNYNLAVHQRELQGSFIKKRCSEVYCLNRKDVNVMCSWVVTKPKEITEAETKDFFQQTYNFLSKRYGKENVVSAYVHMDETTPHIHFTFVPVVYDKKKSRHTVSAKQVLTRSELKRFHPELEQYLEHYFGKYVGIENGATKLGNQNKEQLRINDKLKAKAQEYKSDIVKYTKVLSNTYIENNGLINKNAKLKSENDRYKSENDRYQKNIDCLVQELSYAKSEFIDFDNKNLELLRQIRENEQDLSDCKSFIEALEEKKKILENDVNEYMYRIDNLKSDINDKILKSGELDDILHSKRNEIFKTEEKLGSLRLIDLDVEDFDSRFKPTMFGYKISSENYEKIKGSFYCQYKIRTDDEKYYKKKIEELGKLEKEIKEMKIENKKLKDNCNVLLSENSELKDRYRKLKYGSDLFDNFLYLNKDVGSRFKEFFYNSSNSTVDECEEDFEEMEM
jgi:chromosome segregation ATPase